MSESRKVVLAEPFQGQRGTVIELNFRAPTFNDYMDLGEPETMVGIESGAFFQEDIAVIRKYIERLVDVDPNFLGKLGLRDTIAVKRTVLGFFRDATRTNETPKEDAPTEASGSGSPENSSSAAAKAFEPSVI